MLSIFKKLITYAIALAAVITIAFYFRGYFTEHISTIENVSHSITDTAANDVAALTGTEPPAPCSQPIIYSLGTFDDGFGLTKAQFLDDVNEAAQIWNKPFGKVFFELASSTSSGTPSDNDLTINLIYDYRQEATNAMNTVGVSINDQTSVYDALKAKYDSLTTTYTTSKAALVSIETSFNAAQDSYNQQVNYWNSHGGAPAAQYAQLSQEKSALQSQAAQITADQDQVNASVTTINSTASTINKYVALLNSEADKYNSIASSTGEEFDEGEYVEDATGNHIDIFQYDTQTKLIRVLAHELGHALGLGHSYTNPQAIMYPLNQGTNLYLAPEDITALDAICGIPTAVGASK